MNKQASKQALKKTKKTKKKPNKPNIQTNE
jgi:hypothetical protein